MKHLQAGFARVNVTPMLGISMSGYYEDRFAEGAKDELELSALALSVGDTTALFLSLDILEIRKEIIDDFKESITKATDVPGDCIYIHSSHIHTGPTLVKDSPEQLVREYYQFLIHKMAFVSKAALEDRKPAKMGWAVGTAPAVSFIRRFRMKDGSVKTNPGIGNPNIEAPIGETDRQVMILRFDREHADTLVFVSFGNHPDVVSGCSFSADWPGFLRRITEQALPECKCIVFNGCQGNVNHVNVFPKDTDLPLIREPQARYNFARYIGRALAGTVLQEYDKVKYVDVDVLRCLQKTIHIPAKRLTPEQIAEAHKIQELHAAGRDDEIPGEGMMRTTLIAEALHFVELEHGPTYFDMTLSGAAIGPVGLIGMPGEPFAAVGLELKKAEGWDMIIPMALTNGGEGYFPTKDAFDEGGYEARSSHFEAGVAEQMIHEGIALLKELKRN